MPRGAVPALPDVHTFWRGEGATMRRAGAVLATIIGLGAGACAHEHQRSAAAEPKAPLPVTPEALDKVVETADASEPGRVRRMEDGFLVIDPYRASLGRERLRLPAQAPVFEGSAQVGVQNLQPGTDVRVFYRFPKGEEPPEVVGVRVLAPEEAKMAEDASKEPRRPE